MAWTKARLKKFQKTMAAKKKAKGRVVRIPLDAVVPVVDSGDDNLQLIARLIVAVAKELSGGD